MHLLFTNDNKVLKYQKFVKTIDLQSLAQENQILLAHGK